MIDCIRNEYTELLDQFPELTRPAVKGETVKHGITHNIVTKGHPVFVPDKLVTAKRGSDQMIKLGVIKPSDSEWSSVCMPTTYGPPPKKKMATGDHREITEV